MADVTSRAFCDLDTWFFFPQEPQKVKAFEEVWGIKARAKLSSCYFPKSGFFFESLILLFKAHCVVWLINRFCREQRSPCMYERVFRTQALPCQGHQCLRPKGTARSFPVQSSDTVCGKYQPLNQGFLLHGNWTPETASLEIPCQDQLLWLLFQMCMKKHWVSRLLVLLHHQGPGFLHTCLQFLHSFTPVRALPEPCRLLPS